ncbi:hypothetical protein AXX17_AT5G31240 [Arabidopsis thaliana]|uniref:Uncharacterized protein n=1 Tax=Arabidopsis thaliana TaxID=3702 RepID=A0A178UDB1_ARATH|nr:hypothetical protein AXX17_AT5G31240 [Arabidopsis thaliana]
MLYIGKRFTSLLLWYNPLPAGGSCGFEPCQSRRIQYINSPYRSYTLLCLKLMDYIGANPINSKVFLSQQLRIVFPYLKKLVQFRKGF